MEIQAGVGVSHHRNPRVAGREAAEQALAAAGLSRPEFVFLFASVGYPQAPLLAAVRQATGDAPLTGCSGEGVIARNEADESNFAVGVMVLSGKGIRFQNGIATGLKADSVAVGSRVAEGVGPHLGADAVALFALADGLTVNFDRLLQGFEGSLQADRRLPLLGGTSADNWAFKQTYQYCDDQVVSDGVAWALLSGDVRVASAVNHGCVPIGGKRTVTRSRENVICEIDGRPALEVLKEYILAEEVDSWDKAVINLCLGFRTPAYLQGYDDYMIRFIPGRNEADGSITIQTEVPEGCDIWMTRRDPARMADGIDRLGREVAGQLGGAPARLVLQFDCCGRGKVILREPVKLEFQQKLRQAIGPEAPWLGFYTLGEIGPVGGRNCFHNYTAVVTALY
ncbi:MAG: FIST C-terminal domain-containing protein [Armatimonadetes bacterium]|nr:FIST C-terminal domain-containing protein [Armatimonadota bacterium]